MRRLLLEVPEYKPQNRRRFHELMRRALFRIQLSKYLFSVVEVSADTTLDDSVDVLHVDATNGDVDVTLPDPTNGCEFTIKKTDSSGNSVLVSGSVNIEGSSTVDLSSQYDFVTVYGDGSLWWKRSA